jgi:hypothetical protein
MENAIDLKNAQERFAKKEEKRRRQLRAAESVEICESVESVRVEVLIVALSFSSQLASFSIYVCGVVCVCVCVYVPGNFAASV